MGFGGLGGGVKLSTRPFRIRPEDKVSNLNTSAKGWQFCDKIEEEELRGGPVGATGSEGENGLKQMGEENISSKVFSEELHSTDLSEFEQLLHL